jgi:hypothetical protein
MSRVEAVSAWEATVSRQLPQLSGPQARVLAWWSYGVVLAQRCGQTSVAAALALLLGQRENTVRQRLREWCYAAEDKRGAHRQAVEVATCFAPLLGWVLHWWAPGERRLALALDATTLGTRFTVLALCVVYRGCAVPVAWAVVGATRPGAWRPHWEGLLRQVQGSVPADWTVLVLADRGLYAPWLFATIIELGWHPGLRVNGGAGSGLYRLLSGGRWRPLAGLLDAPGRVWCGQVFCFREQTVRCTLLARWEVGYREGWLLVTDLPPTAADVAWYGLRAWVEAGFKDLKRDGWQWQHTHMTDPERAARLWLVLAVATLWAVSVGGAAEANLPASTLQALPATHVARKRTAAHHAPRLLSCFRRGLLALVIGTAYALPFPTARFLPEPWPTGFVPKTYP